MENPCRFALLALKNRLPLEKDEWALISLFRLDNDRLDLGQSQLLEGPPTALPVDDAKILPGKTNLDGLLLPMTLDAQTELFYGFLLAD
jgi:hypothetical protein